ncbi:hypothetical protein QEN19_002503 [Hanseniaspora menglaensis]
MSEQKEVSHEDEIISKMLYFSNQFNEVVKPSFENIRSIIKSTKEKTGNVEDNKLKIIHEFETLNKLLNGDYINNYFKLGDVLIANREDTKVIKSSTSELNELEYQVINKYIEENKLNLKESDYDTNSFILHELLSIMSDLAYPQFKKNYIPDYEFVTLDDGRPVMKFKMKLNDVIEKVYKDNEELINKDNSNGNKVYFQSFLKELEQTLVTGLEAEQKMKIKTNLHIQVDLINKYNELNNTLDILNTQKEEYDTLNIEKQVNDLISSLTSIIK